MIHIISLMIHDKWIFIFIKLRYACFGGIEKEEKIMKKMIAIMVVFALLFTLPVSVYADGQFTDYLALVGNVSGDGVENDTGSHYYAFSPFNRTYNKISASVNLPSDAHVDLTGSNGSRAAYISFGIKGNHAIDFGLTKTTSHDWHVYAYNTSTRVFKRVSSKTYSGTVTMSLESQVKSNGQTEVILRVGNDVYKASDLGVINNASFSEWRGLADNSFYRFVSLVNVNASNQNIEDGTMLRGVGFRDLTIYKARTNSSQYPTGSVRQYEWAFDSNNGHIDRAWTVYPDKIGIHPGSGASEYINIKHMVDPIV